MTAYGAAAGPPYWFRTETPALRIMTPSALQRTAFEKYRGTNTGAIVDSILLYIEYDPFFLQDTPAFGRDNMYKSHNITKNQNCQRKTALLPTASGE